MGVRRKTLSERARPCRQAKVTTHPILKKLYMARKALAQLSLRVCRSSQRKRHICSSRKTPGIMSSGAVNGRITN